MTRPPRLACAAKQIEFPLLILRSGLLASRGAGEGVRG